MKLFEKNLDAEGSGLVVASPDHATGPGGVAKRCEKHATAKNYDALCKVQHRRDVFLHASLQEITTLHGLETAR